MKINKLFSKIFLVSTSVIAISAATFFATSCSNIPSAPQIRYAFAEDVFCNVEPTVPTEGVNRSKLEIFNIFDKQAPRADGEKMTLEEIQKTFNTIIYMDLALVLSDSADVKSFSITECDKDVAPSKLTAHLFISFLDEEVSSFASVHYNGKDDDLTRAYLDITFNDAKIEPRLMPSYIYRNTLIKV